MEKAGPSTRFSTGSEGPYLGSSARTKLFPGTPAVLDFKTRRVLGWNRKRWEIKHTTSITYFDEEKFVWAVFFSLTWCFHWAIINDMKHGFVLIFASDGIEDQDWRETFLEPWCSERKEGSGDWNGSCHMSRCWSAQSVATLVPPADSPNMVTLFESPPNSSMFSCTHFNAAIWSIRP